MLDMIVQQRNGDLAMDGHGQTLWSLAFCTDPA